MIKNIINYKKPMIIVFVLKNVKVSIEEQLKLFIKNEINGVCMF